MTTPSIVNLSAILASLALRRPVFHSEADLRHAFAWELQQWFPSANIRLEKRISTEGSRIYLDLLFKSLDAEVAIELKYKTRCVRLAHAEETYNLLNQSAQDIGRHDFLKDVRRLERYVERYPAAVGYAILLTNDPTYWSESKKIDSVDSAFRLHEGRVVKGEVTWGSMAAAGTKHKREEIIALRGEYPIIWRDYSSHGIGNYKQFRYVTVRVANDI